MADAGLAPDRYQQVDDELRRAAHYFERLAAEVDATEPTGKHGLTWAKATQVVAAIEELRHVLGAAQASQGQLPAAA